MQLSRASFLIFGLSLVQLFGLHAHADDASNVFGQSQQSEAAFIGVMYDLKQTPTRQPTTIDPNSYWTVLDEFLAKHWDESVLNRYYRVSRPLFTTQIFIPNMSADTAPKAFGAEKTVKPSLWVIHYKAQVSAPLAGTYRFWGAADDALAVAVNGQTELVAFYTDPVLKNGWKEKGPRGAPAGEGIPLDGGDWFNVGAGEIMDLDVIIGERPGGSFNAFLMVEKQGETYKKTAQGFSILPIFQVAPYDTPAGGSEPEFAKGFQPWKSYQ
jgi:hypothetical protein